MKSMVSFSITGKDRLQDIRAIYSGSNQEEVKKYLSGKGIEEKNISAGSSASGAEILTISVPGVIQFQVAVDQLKLD